jgi:CheY-like chemotaxis protein
MPAEIHCLLIDDDRDDQDIFRLALSDTGIPVKLDIANEGNSGLKKLASGPRPDFVFLDLNMPHMDGKTCLTKIRKDPKLKDLPVIIYSTSSYIDDIRETRRLGATGFVTKPSNVNDLVEILGKILRNEYQFFTSAYYQ